MSVIVDNTVFTNFALIEREDILKKVFEDTLFTSEAVMIELKQGEEKGILPKRDWNWINVLKLSLKKKSTISKRLVNG